MPGPITTDRTFRIDAERSDVWEAVGRVEDYRRWWPWLREFEAGRLQVGQEWACAVRPPLPYELRFTVELVDVVEAARVAASVSGDIAGSAELFLDDAAAGTDVRLVSSLAPRRGTLKVVSGVVPWIARYGHDWVLDAGARQFRDRALGG